MSKFDSINSALAKILDASKENQDAKVYHLLLKQLGLFRTRLSDKDSELKNYIELALQENEDLKVIATKNRK